MSAPVSDPVDPTGSPEAFLQQQLPRALVYARLCGAGGGAPEQAVAEAADRFRRRCPGRPPARWPALFWAGLVGRAEALPSAAASTGDRLQTALLALPLAVRQAFLLRVWLDFDDADAARLLEWPVARLRAALVAALRQLAPRLAAEGERHWPRHCRQALERRAAALPAATRGRLEQARRDAAAGYRRRLRRRRRLGMTLLLAGGAVIATLALRPTRLDDPARPPPAALAALDSPRRIPVQPIEQLLSLPAEDLALLAGEQDFALLDGLAFYRWRAEQAARGDDGH